MDCEMELDHSDRATADLRVAIKMLEALDPRSIARELAPIADHAAVRQVLEIAIEYPTELVLAALDAGADPRVDGSKLLDIACTRGRIKIVDRLFAPRPAGCGLAAEDARHVLLRRRYPLLNACCNGHAQVVRRLFEAGLGADDARVDNNYALHRVCAKGFLDVLDLLRGAGLDADDVRLARDADDLFIGGSYQSVIAACRHGHINILDRLFAPLPAGFGVPVDRLLVIGCRALEYVAITGIGDSPRVIDWVFAAAPALAANEGIANNVDYFICSGKPASVAAMFRHGAALRSSSLKWCKSTAVARVILDRWGGTPELEAAEAGLDEPARARWAALSRPE